MSTPRPAAPRATRWSAYLLLPIAFFFERSAWFGGRSIFWEHLAGDGASDADVASSVVRTMGWLVVLSPIGGAAAGYFLGARRTLLVGLLLLAAGYLLVVGGGSGSSAWASAIVLALGVGFVRPAFLAVAGAAAPDPQETPRTTLFLLLYLFTIAAGIGAPAFVGNFRAGDYPWIFGLAAGLAVAAVVFAGAHLATAGVQKAAEPGPPPGADPVRGAAVLLGALFLAICAQSLGASLLAGSPMQQQAPSLLHPALVAAACAMLGLVWIGLSFGARVRAVVPAAVGLCVLVLLPFFLAPAVLNLGWRWRTTQALSFIAATAVLAIAEALVMPFLLARLSSNAPARWSVAFPAAWILATSVASALLALTPNSLVVQSIATAVVIAGCLVAGILLIVRRQRLYALFEGAAARS